MKFLILLNVLSCTFRYNVFVVKKHLLDSDILSFNTKTRMGVTIITVIAFKNVITMLYDSVPRNDNV